jgi:glutamine synthetase
LGFSFYTHPEIEFFLLRDRPEPGRAADPRPIDQGGYFDQMAHDVGHDFRREAITMLERMGISVEFSHHEVAPGQQEIDLRYADALTTADNIMTFRLVVKEVALEQGVYATFMPKPFSDQPGSGMHTHLSLFEGDRNAFHDPSGPHHLSKTARAFIAGLLVHAAEISAVTNQWVNSYKRLVFGGEAPAYICWGHNNRSALVRVPMYKPHKGNATRVEIRSPDSACNPYLAFAVLLAAGLKGIEEGYELPPGADDDVWSLTDAERYAMGINPLPRSLYDAIRAMEGSELVAETLGEHVFDFFLRNKRAEWVEYRNRVTPFELERYLPVL